MSEKQKRRYPLSGELSPQQWQRVLTLAGGLGLELAASDETDGEQRSATTEIPYSLDEIGGADMHVGVEHATEFWPEYKKGMQGKRAIERWRAALAFKSLTEPKHRTGPHGTGSGDPRILARTLGLEVQDRVEAGFPTSEQSRVVVSAGSFINTVRHMAKLSTRERPHLLTDSVMLFLDTFATQLEAQIINNPTPNSR